MTRRDAPFFKVTTGREGDTAVVTVAGELDIAGAGALRETFLKLLAGEETPPLVVDGSGLTFVDSSGLAVLLMAARRWEDAGSRLVLRDPSPTLTRIVDLTGVRRAFDF
ncbi:MAG TPA: STAS domain-containing protein [Frankiaceae bacterium]|nr:STAS domain-containing protein [Frankiaceae bacterium]